MMTDRSDQPSLARMLIVVALLWLIGNALRLTILAVPPALPSIHDDLHLSATQVGLLTGLPPMLLGLAAVPGSLLIARLGVLPALIVGLVLAAIGGALRGVYPHIALLYGMTIVTGAGVAIMQVTMPTVVRLWMPKRIGFATAIYTNALVIGEIIPVRLSIPVILPWVGSWQWSFAVWSAPVIVIAVLVWAFAPRVQQPASTLAAARRWWPDWNDSLIWKLGLMLGAVNASYFGCNAFLPDYLTHTGQVEWISPALTALNVGQLPASLLLLGAASRLERATWPYLFAGLGIIAALFFVVFGRGLVVVAAASVIGFFCALILILALALPPLLAAPEDVHRVSAAMFTISYSCAIIIPVICGAVWDFTGIPRSTFVPMGIMCVVLIVLAPSVTHVGRRT